MNGINNHKKYLNLRRKYPYFEFQSYSFNFEKQVLNAEFVFNISDQFYFKPGFKIPSRSFYKFQDLNTNALNSLVFHIGMVELVSYWKATCSPNVIIKPYMLDQWQVGWWKKLYFNGLGEFFYLNGINSNIEDFMNIASKGTRLKKIGNSILEDKSLVPIGGGKDSVVSLELLKRGGVEIIPMIMNPREAAIRTIQTAGFELENAAVVERTIDKNLLELNKKGFLNGHTPFSSLLAFMNLLLAEAAGVKYIALSNESSANESTVPGTNINHQYSKSLEFENDFRSYYKKYIDDQPEYYSFLRPLNELQISQIFSGFPAHFAGFRSCNVGSKTDSWCGTCPKCLFTFLILSPFVSREDICQIFGNNLFENESLQPILDELTGKTTVKPFECVGTTTEVIVALWKAVEQYNGNELPVLLKNFVRSFGLIPVDKDYSLLIKQFDEHHNIPSNLVKLLKDNLSPGLKQGFVDSLRKKFEKPESLLILGFGKEGQSTFRFLKDNFPGLRIAVADSNSAIAELKMLSGFDPDDLFLGDHYSDSLNRFQLIIKSPGVKLDVKGEELKKITSQTELFLEYYRDNTIGVTGTKGKSTTVTLIHHLLNKAGLDNVLLGNIGVPPFDRVDLIRKDTIIVFELSAHQLQHINTSPTVGILLNIFPEHLDYFGNLESYAHAKKNLFAYQQDGDVMIIHRSQVGDIEQPKANMQVFYADDENGADDSETGIPLKEKIIGKHNENNVLAAVIAVANFGVPFEKSIEYLSDFKPLPHRLEYLGKHKGIHFYNDSISTVPESTIAALEALKNTDTLILGGFDRGLDYLDLIEFLFQSKVRNFVFMGQVGKTLMPIFQERVDHNKKFFFVNDLAAAFPIILQQTKPGAICLLSPAASSYDQFHNFEHRGDAFRSLVGQLSEK